MIFYFFFCLFIFCSVLSQNLLIILYLLIIFIFILFLSAILPYFFGNIQLFYFSRSPSNHFFIHWQKSLRFFPPSIFPLVKFELISCYYYHIECGSEYRRAIWRTMLKSNKRAFCQQKNLKKTLKIYFVLVIISGASKTNPVKWKDHHL